jgi:hypothetical protein
MGRGRPKTGGVKPGWMLFRSLVFLEHYKLARDKGLKYADAISAGIDGAIKKLDCPMSEREAARIIKEFGWEKRSTKSLIVIEGKISFGNPIRYQRKTTKPSGHSLMSFSRKYAKKHLT